MGTILILNNDDILGPRISIKLDREQKVRGKVGNIFRFLSVKLLLYKFLKHLTYDRKNVNRLFFRHIRQNIQFKRYSTVYTGIRMFIMQHVCFRLLLEFFG